MLLRSDCAWIAELILKVCGFNGMKSRKSFIDKGKIARFDNIFILFCVVSIPQTVGQMLEVCPSSSKRDVEIHRCGLPPLV